MPNHPEEIQEDSFSSDAELDEETDESSTDIDAKLEEEDVFDVEFFKCYSALKKRDGKIYDQNVKFFQDHDSSSSDNDDKIQSNDADAPIETKRKKTTAPKMTLLDHQLKVNEDEIEEPSLDRVKIDLNKEVSKSFYEKELEEIKKSIEKVGEQLDSESDDDDLLVVKDKSDNNVAAKSKDKLKTILDKIEDQEDEDLQHLKSVWSNPKNLTEEDRFLRDYILNKRYLAKKVEDDDDDADDEDEKDGFFSKNIEELSDVEGDEEGKPKRQVVAHRSDERDFDQIARIPRNSTKTIRDIVEKQEKKEKRLKKLEKEKKKKKALKDADCEDIVGDLPTKFHYRETEPNDYGLTAEELLLATDEELEKWISLKDCIAYKSPEEERALKKKFDQKRNDIDLKRQIFKSIYEGANTTADGPGEQTGDFADQSAISAPSATKKRKKRGKKRKLVNSDSESSFKESANDSIQNQSALLQQAPQKAASIEQKGAGISTESNRQRKKKRKKRGMNHKKFAKIGVAPDRLLAYGLSKTKLKKSKIL